MKKINLALIMALVALSACSKKPVPKLCTVTIADPAKKETKKRDNCIKRKTLWRQLGIEK